MTPEEIRSFGPPNYTDARFAMLREILDRFPLRPSR